MHSTEPRSSGGCSELGGGSDPCEVLLLTLMAKPVGGFGGLHLTPDCVSSANVRELTEKNMANSNNFDFMKQPNI